MAVTILEMRISYVARFTCYFILEADADTGHAHLGRKVGVLFHVVGYCPCLVDCSFHRIELRSIGAGAVTSIFSGRSTTFFHLVSSPGWLKPVQWCNFNARTVQPCFSKIAL